MLIAQCLHCGTEIFSDGGNVWQTVADRGAVCFTTPGEPVRHTPMPDGLKGHPVPVVSR